VVITTGGREWKGGVRRGGGGGVWANGREAAVGFWRGCVCVCVCVAVGLKGVPGMKVCGHTHRVVCGNFYSSTHTFIVVHRTTIYVLGGGGEWGPEGCAGYEGTHIAGHIYSHL
jgi:hypothetical protein